MPLLQGTNNAGDAAWSNDITSEITTTKGVTGGTALVVGGRAFTSLADSTPIVQAAALGTYDVSATIPANTLNTGTTLRIRAVVRISVSINGTVACTSQITLGGAIIVFSGNSANTPLTGTRCLLDVTLTFRGDAGAAVAASGVGTAVWGNSVAVVTMDPNAGDAVPTFATNGALVVAVGTTPAGAGNSSGRHVLEQLLVEID